MQIGDIPDAEIRPPENVLFVCKLNPVTEVSAYFVFSVGNMYVYVYSLICFTYFDFDWRSLSERTDKDKLAENMRVLSFLQHFYYLHPVSLVPLS